MLNITLFIQVLNFLIAYWFLARFFFKPVLGFIHQESQKELFLNHAVVDCHAILKNCYIKKQQIWQTASSEFHKYLDFCQLIGVKPKAQDRCLSANELSSGENTLLTNELAQTLVDKIIAME
jgi:hypothetical protein